MKVTTKALWDAVGGLSQPSKMPGFAYGTPAKRCKVGSILWGVKGSVCSHCYARKGMYCFPCVARAQEKRLAILSANLAEWTANMTALLSRKYAKREKVFRWHDSGDLQSAEHLDAIVTIANNLPDFQFWLPTKEYALVRSYGKPFPSNLTVRVSTPMIGRAPTPIPGTVSSTVDAGVGYTCKAPSQGGSCVDCRACWTRSVANVDYAAH